MRCDSKAGFRGSLEAGSERLILRPLTARPSLVRMRSVIPQIMELAVQVVRFVDDCQPGIVACEFVDADGRRHALIDKAPIFSAEALDANSEYPQPGTARCAVLHRWRDACGRVLVRVSIADPDSIESSEGLSEFVVLLTQVSAPHGP